MLLSISLIILLSLLLMYLCNLIKFPGLIGMLITGMILGPYGLNLIDSQILKMGSELRQIALVVILIRAGLSLDLADLKKIGKPALLLSFIPALFEIISITLFAPLIFDIPYLEAALLGSIIAAVSPAVIVPRMIKLIHKLQGKPTKIPHMILAGASLDDIFVIVIFTSLLGLYQQENSSLLRILEIPTSIILGALTGIFIGLFLVWFFKKFHIRDTIKVLIMFSFGFLMVVLENELKVYILFSGLVSIMTIGMTIVTKYPTLSKRLVGKYEKIWVIAEIMLFVLVGALLDLSLIRDILWIGILFIIIGLLFRVLGVMLSLSKTKFSIKEKSFVAMSYLPKATVQAAIGSIPFALGLPSGELILTLSILSILFTAPLGAILIERFSSLIEK